MKKVHIGIIVGGIVVAIILALSLSSKSDKDQNTISKMLSLEDAESAFSEGKFLEARTLYKNAMENATNINKLKKIQKRLEDINIKIILSPILDECSVEYVVRPKDVLIKIARKFGTTVNLIKRSNNLSSDTIRLGQKLKINTCKFSIVVDKSQNLLFLKKKGEVIKTYIVSTGKDNSTPTGTL